MSMSEGLPVQQLHVELLLQKLLGCMHGTMLVSLQGNVQLYHTLCYRCMSQL